VTTPNARDVILSAVRAARPPSVAYPDVGAATRAFATATSELVERFTASARAAAADVVIGARGDVARLIGEIAPAARQVLSCAPGVTGNLSVSGDGHVLASLDLFVCEAELGVAENGAVWLAASRLGERSALFLAAQVVVVLDRAALVSDLHEAYARIDMTQEAFGIFVAGPSKTADIEQSLVIGAHGAKQLTVLLTS
jgi:L-lactate dehydrogenase complex protein LldG